MTSTPTTSPVAQRGPLRRTAVTLMWGGSHLAPVERLMIAFGILGMLTWLGFLAATGRVSGTAVMLSVWVGMAAGWCLAWPVGFFLAWLLRDDCPYNCPC